MIRTMVIRAAGAADSAGAGKTAVAVAGAGAPGNSPLALVPGTGSGRGGLAAARRRSRRGRNECRSGRPAARAPGRRMGIADSWFLPTGPAPLQQDADCVLDGRNRIRQGRHGPTPASRACSRPPRMCLFGRSFEVSARTVSATCASAAGSSTPTGADRSSATRLSSAALSPARSAGAGSDES